MSAELLHHSDDLVGMGFPVFLSASNKGFLGELVGTEVDDRREATFGAHALGIALGCRILRAHDVEATAASPTRCRPSCKRAETTATPSRGRLRMVLRLIVGDDPILVGEAITSAVDELVGAGDRSLMLETLTEVDYRNDDGGWEAAKVLDAARTPPFLTERRVVVGRHLGRFPKKDEYSPIIDLLGEALDTTDLVLVWERGVEPKMDRMPALPKALKEAAELAGAAVVQTSAPKGKAAGDWLRDQLGASSLNFDRRALAAVEDLLGEDRSRVVGLVRTLEGALGQGANVTADDIATFGGDQGSTVPWALDDAIDKGDVAAALAILPRLIPYDGSPTDRNGAAFRLLAVLHKRYSNMLRLDGADVRDDKAAAALLGMKGSTFPAKKAMQQSRRLGTDKLTRAIELLADADLSLRGTKDWPPELVVEVLVARLANLSGRR